VSKLIDAADTPFHRTLLMTAYGTGARRAEIVNLQLTDIDKSMMRIHIREGKGGKDREVSLSPTLYQELRQHYRRLGRKPTLWLFPGGRYHSSDDPISDKVIWHACRTAAQRAGIRKPVHPHTLRHYASSRTMPRRHTKNVYEPVLCCVLAHGLVFAAWHSPGGSNQSPFRKASRSSSGL
jgi:integrase/recombinase XerD